MDMEVKLEIETGIRNIGKIVKDVRQEVGLDLKTVANESGLDYKFLYDLEEGQIEINKIEIKNIRKLLEYLPFTYFEKNQIVDNLKNSINLYDKENDYTKFYENKRVEKKIIDNMFYIFAMEMMHAVQAIDLRDNYRLGNRVQIAYDEIRKVVPFYDKDRPIYKC